MFPPEVAVEFVMVSQPHLCGILQKDLDGTWGQAKPLLPQVAFLTLLFLVLSELQLHTTVFSTFRFII